MSGVQEDIGSVARLLGWALFNHYKGNHEAVGTLLRKAYKTLVGKEWGE